MYVKCGLVLKAAEEAFRMKDVRLLESLREKVSASSGSSGGGGVGAGTGNEGGGGVGGGQVNAGNEIERMIARLRPSR